MGLFDKLFNKQGKQNNISESKTEKQTPAMPKYENLDGFQVYTPTANIPAVSPVSTVLKPISYDEVESLISSNPLSAVYRRETQQQTFSMHTLSSDDFFEKSKGSFIALDLETTGLDDSVDKIVEIGAVKVKNHSIIDKYQQLVFPNIHIPESASAVNHITDNMLTDQPFIFQVLPDRLAFVDHHIIVAHNAAFDIKFLAQACLLYRFKMPRQWFDSMDLKPYYPETKSRSLKSLLSAACIENSDSHRALSDSESLARLVIATYDRIQKLEKK